MANYGDVALGLKPEWDRSSEHNQEYALRIVGHTNGVADARLKNDPDKRHQFAWVDPTYLKEVNVNRTKGYVFVNKNTGWEKADNLWEWNAEGNLLYEGQLLMARPGELYWKDLDKRIELRGGVKDNADEEAENIAARAGIRISREEGRRRSARG